MDAIEQFQQRLGGPFTEMLQHNWMILVPALVLLTVLVFYFGDRGGDGVILDDGDDAGDAGDGGGDGGGGD